MSKFSVGMLCTLKLVCVRVRVCDNKFVTSYETAACLSDMSVFFFLSVSL
jgi:hypothetical protein